MTTGGRATGSAIRLPRVRDLDPGRGRDPQQVVEQEFVIGDDQRSVGHDASSPARRRQTGNRISAMWINFGHGNKYAGPVGPDLPPAKSGTSQ